MDLGRLAAVLLAFLGLAAESPRGAGIELVLTAEKAAYAQNEPISLRLMVFNRGSEAVTLRFRTAQRYDVVFRDAQHREVWRWSAGQMFAQVLGEEMLPARGALRYRVTVRQRFPPGRYTAVATIPAEGEPISASLEITVR